MTNLQRYALTRDKERQYSREEFRMLAQAMHTDRRFAVWSGILSIVWMLSGILTDNLLFAVPALLFYWGMWTNINAYEYHREDLDEGVKRLTRSIQRK
jgi:hypothetical protein